MKKAGIFLFVLTMLLSNARDVSAGACTMIKSGELEASDGSTIMLGVDDWGYNYQAQKFDGGYCGAYRDAAWCQAYKDVHLAMKWNDAWLSKTDCDDDNALDRHYGDAAYIGSGAWLTNHMSGEYEGEDGETCSWNYFTKIVAAPADGYVSGGLWYSADDVEIGPQIWGEFATIQEVSNDACAGDHGLLYRSLDHAGFGGW